jgi:hypothetical protein
MYERQCNSGQIVEWNPEDSDLAAEAMANVEGTGVSRPTEAHENAPVSFESDEIPAKAREEYSRLKEEQTA